MTNAMNTTSVAVSFALALAACSSRPAERVAPAESGPRPRQCQRLRKAPDPAWENAVEKHAHWNVSLSKDPHGETLGVVNLDWTFWAAGDNAYAGEACVETTGVPKNVSLDPDLKVDEFVEKDQRIYVRLFLYLTVHGPAKKVPDQVLAYPELLVAWNIAARPSNATIDVARNDTTFSPPWDDAKVTAKAADPVIDR